MRREHSGVQVGRLHGRGELGLCIAVEGRGLPLREAKGNSLRAEGGKRHVGTETCKV